MLNCNMHCYHSLENMFIKRLIKTVEEFAVFNLSDLYLALSMTSLHLGQGASGKNYHAQIFWLLFTRRRARCPLLGKCY